MIHGGEVAHTDEESGPVALRIEVLGGVRATRGGSELKLGGPRARSVLAALVVARGRPTSEDGLIEAAWDGEPPPAARQSLHTYVARLRGELEPGRSARAESTVLTRTSAGYSLAAASVDAWRFGDLVARGGGALREGRPHEAVAALDEALASWAGEPYGDLSDRAFVQADVARLTELHTAAREDRAAAGLAVGEDAALLPGLESLTAEHPLRERGWELRARALYRCGRQADALAALRAARTVLLDELGVDPGPSLQQLERAILDQDPSLAHAEPAPAASVPAAQRPPSNLPVPLTPLVGREAELDALREELGRNRLVTVVGPGGVGKTRLAIDAARPDPGVEQNGPWLVELAGLTEPSLLAVTVAEALGVVTAQNAEMLAAILREASVLVVLDNCEHLADAVAELLTAVLPQCPGVRVLATSREPLDVPGEQLFELGPLTGTSDPAQLFVDRARAVAPRWAPTDDELAHVSAICRELDGLPLAIELAAARSRSMSVSEIAAALDDRFALLVGGPRTAPDRHRSLEASLSLSVDELDPGRRRLFALLSAFAGGFDAAAATAVSGDSPLATADGLGVLVAKSLVTVDLTTSGPRRYLLLETLRSFGARIQSDAERSDTRARHRAWVRDLVTEADRNWLGPDAVTWFGRVRTEQANVRRAFETALADGDADTALRLSGAMGWYWYRTGRIAEGIGWATAALAAAGPDADPEAVGLAHFAAGPLQYLAGDGEGAAASIAAGLAGMDATREPTKVTRGLAFQANLAGAQDPAAAPALAQRALETARALGDGPGEAESLMTLGIIARLGGASDTAIELLDASIAVARMAGHGFAEGSSAWIRVKTRLDRGEVAQALGEATAVVRAFGAQPDVTSWLVAVHVLGGALGAAGDGEAGARLLGAVSAIGGDVGFRPEQMDPADSERNVKLVRAALSAEQYATAFSAGVAGGRDTVAEVLAGLGADLQAVERSEGRTA